MTVEIRGKLYDGQSAAVGQDSVAVCSKTGGFLLLGHEPAQFKVGDIRISERLGAIPRILLLPNGKVFESPDNDAIDKWLEQCGRPGSWRFRLESNWHFAFAALALVGVVIVAAARWGIPFASDVIAEKLPSEVDSFIAAGALDALDATVFEDSSLVELRRSETKELFKNLQPKESASNFKIEFRGGEWIGANAFALPDGTVVVTDELINLSTNNDELSAVILHEMGHVVHRHSLRQVIRHSWLAMLSLLIVGDVSSAGALVLALPSVLVQSVYSREFETQADDYALLRMRELNINPVHFANLMQRMERCGLYEDEELQQCREKEPDDSNKDATEESNWLEYLSTHPTTSQRLRRFKAPKN